MLHFFSKQEKDVAYVDERVSRGKNPISEHPWRAGKAVQEIFIIINWL